jgi:hypothetical protein
VVLLCLFIIKEKIMEHKLKIELTAQEVNAVLNALAQMPYAQVANLFANVQQQAQAQVQQAPAEPEPAAE